jgi:hypothetical protein
VKGGLAVSSDAERSARSGVSVETVFPLEADGLAGWLYRLGPGDECTLPEPSKSGGQYLVVTAGALIMENAELARHSAAFIRPAEPAFRVVAGQSGLDLLVLQFPRLLANAKQTAVPV